jgi:hypothetical protein
MTPSVPGKRTGCQEAKNQRKHFSLLMIWLAFVGAEMRICVSQPSLRMNFPVRCTAIRRYNAAPTLPKPGRRMGFGGDWRLVLVRRFD